MEILSIYETWSTDIKVYSKLMVQSLPENEERLKKRVEEMNNRFFRNGDYVTRWELYRHPQKSTKPYLEKYRIA